MAETYLSLPFRLDGGGNVAVADLDEHIGQRLAQILFTSPGERVMLPEFGSGVRDLVFAANGGALAAAAEFTIARALQTSMGREVMINVVDVEADEEKLRIRIVFTRVVDLREQEMLLTFTRTAALREAEAPSAVNRITQGARV
jgi:uncharacterized protein